MSEKKKRNIIIGTLCVAVLLMAVGYAAFASILNISGTSSISSEWNIKITDIQSKNVVGSASNASTPTYTDLSATFVTNLVSPGDAIEYEITVTNAGTINALLEKITLSDSNNPAIKFTTSGLTEGDVLTAGNSTKLIVKVEYDSSVTSQPGSTTGNLTVDLDYVQEGTGSGGTGGGTDADFAGITVPVVDSGDGLYEDEYIAGRYIYRGSNPDNYIKFNNEEYRIVSVESDNTIKIIRNGNLGDRAFDAHGNRSYVENTYDVGFTYNNAWAAVGGIFTNGSVSGTVTKDSSLNTYLNETYYNTLSADAKYQIQTHTFNTGGTTFNNTDMLAQITAEKAYTWTRNIGLIQASDVARANSDIANCGTSALHFANYTTCMTTNYLIPSVGNYWTITPSSGRSERGMDVSDIGYVTGRDASNGRGVYPTIYLKSDITLGGTGTQSDPYTIN